MEHRQGTRLKIGLPVSVRLGDGHMGWFTSSDVGNGGIALHGKAELARNSIVSLSIEVKKFNSIITETARAVVVHQKGYRIGLMWVSRGISLQRLIPESGDLAAA